MTHMNIVDFKMEDGVKIFDFRIKYVLIFPTGLYAFLR